MKSAPVFLFILLLLSMACRMGEFSSTPLLSSPTQVQRMETPTSFPSTNATVLPSSEETETPVKSILTDLQHGNHDFAMEVDGLKRTFILHVPPAVEQAQSLPLLIVLHGGGGTGRRMQRFLGFDAYADQFDFYVAYPDAYIPTKEYRSGHWNDGRGTEQTSGVDDVKFLLEMIAEIGRRVPLQMSRIYVTGASNGGMMTYRLGCETKGVFAGIAPVIANIPQPIFANCQPSTPLKFLAINGSADPLVPLEGGTVCEGIQVGCAGGQVVSQAESVGLFATAYGCDPHPQSSILPAQVEDGTYVERQIYANCLNGVQVMAYIVHHMGHTWPPMAGQLPAAGKQSHNLDATRLIVEYFFSK